jgi:hypothetical protein
MAKQVSFDLIAKLLFSLADKANIKVVLHTLAPLHPCTSAPLPLYPCTPVSLISLPSTLLLISPLLSTPHVV